MTHKKILTILAFIAIGTPLYATTGGVIGPKISENDRSFQLRNTQDPLTGQIQTRLHYQHSLNSRLRPRIIMQVKDDDDVEVKWDYIRGELMWQFLKSDTLNSAFRVEYNTWSDERKPEGAIAWAGQLQLSRLMYAQINLFSAHNLDDLDAEPKLKYRSRLNVKASDAIGFGMETFSVRTSWKDKTNDQSHQVGPYATYRANKNTSIMISALVGLTDASDEQALRFMVKRRL
ncbi:MAG: hypothetical protein O3A01_05135 [bacterium]|nr:hypothetical protein [bacterium]